eukprot:2859992-Pyramimonas_sp.AAC.1
MREVDAPVALDASLLDAHALDATRVEEVVHEECAGRMGLPQSMQLRGFVRIQSLDIRRGKLEVFDARLANSRAMVMPTLAIQPASWSLPPRRVTADFERIEPWLGGALSSRGAGPADRPLGV